eukprot:scaffold6193_cov123-Isochrysis_galbana.AAC.10
MIHQDAPLLSSRLGDQACAEVLRSGQTGWAMRAHSVRLGTRSKFKPPVSCVVVDKPGAVRTTYNKVSRV